MNGRITIRMIHPAFTPPEMSSRRKMSAKIAMNIQMNMNQKKKTIMVQSTLPKLHSVASMALPSRVGMCSDARYPSRQPR